MILKIPFLYRPSFLSYRDHPFVPWAVPPPDSAIAQLYQNCLFWLKIALSTSPFMDIVRVSRNTLPPCPNDCILSGIICISRDGPFPSLLTYASPRPQSLYHFLFYVLIEPLTLTLSLTLPFLFLLFSNHLFYIQKFSFFFVAFFVSSMTSIENFSSFR